MTTINFFNFYIDFDNIYYFKILIIIKKTKLKSS